MRRILTVFASTLALLAIAPAQAALAAVTTSTSALSFGMTPISTATPSLSITVTNNDAVNRMVGDDVVTGSARFTTNSGCDGAELLPAGTCTILVTFDPVVIGAHSATLTIPTSDGSNPVVMLNGTGAAGVLDVVEDGPFVFGDFPVQGAGTDSQSLTIGNSGDWGMLLQIALVGANASDFQISTTCGTTSPEPLAMTAGCFTDIWFDPASPGAKTAQIVVNASGDVTGPATQIVQLSGTGTDPEIVVTPVALDFGVRDIDAGPSASQFVTIQNTGTGPLWFGQSTPPAGFSYELTGCATLAGTLAAGASCTIELRFDPSVTGSANWTMGIGSGDQDEPMTNVMITAAGGAPEIDLDVTSLGFGAHNLDDGATAVQTFVVRNTGALALTTSITSTNSTEFPLASSDCTLSAHTVPAGGSCTIRASFDPASTGDRASTVTITSNDVDEPTRTVQLTGAGTVSAIVAPRTASISPTAQTFGSRSIDRGPTATQTVTLTNTGSSALTVGSVAITGPGAREFRFGTPSCATGASIAPSASCSVGVRFDPTVPALAEATLTWAHDGVALASTVALSGLGCSIRHRSGCAGNDVFRGTVGIDRIFGGLGADTLMGAGNADQLNGGYNNDVIDGGPGRDLLLGGEGNDKVIGGTQADTIRSGEGNDVVLARDRSRDIVDCGPGRRDTATVDRIDVVRGCEIVRRA